MFELGNEAGLRGRNLQFLLDEKLESDPTCACGRWSVDMFPRWPLFEGVPVFGSAQ